MKKALLLAMIFGLYLGGKYAALQTEEYCLAQGEGYIWLIQLEVCVKCDSEAGLEEIRRRRMQNKSGGG